MKPWMENKGYFFIVHRDFISLVCERQIDLRLGQPDLLSTTPHHSPLTIHADGRIVLSHSVHTVPFIIPEHHMIGVCADADAPHTVQCRLKDLTLLLVGVVVVYDHLVIFAAGENVRETRMEDNAIDIGFVPCECLNASLCLVIPHLHCLQHQSFRILEYEIVTSCDDVGFVTTRIVVDTVHTLLMSHERVVALTVTDGPDLLEMEYLIKL